MTKSNRQLPGTKGSFQQENETLSPATTRKQILPTTEWNLEADPSPVKPSDETSAPSIALD